MHTTSLIGQALGGATGSKTSPAQDAPKKTQDRSFADHVNDAASKPEAAQSQTSETTDSGIADQADSQAAVEADNASVRSEDMVADQATGDSTENAVGEDVETPSEAAIAAGHAALGAEKRSARSADLPEGARVGQKIGQGAVAGSAVAEDGETAASKAAGNTTAQTAGEEKAQGPAAAGAAFAGRETIENQAPARAAQSGSKATAGGGDVKVGEQSAMTVNTEAAQEEGASPARTQTRAADQAVARVAQDKPGAAAATPASPATAADATKSATPASPAEAKASLKAEEKAADARMAAADKATPAAAAAASKTSSADSLPKSVFQMQVENAEAGDSRKARYRTRNGDAQAAAEVAKASTAAAGVQTNAATAVNATTNSAIAMMQALQADTMKLSQAPGLLGDSSGSGLSMTADLPGLPQLLTEAVFQPGITHRPETPRMIASQMAEAFVAKGDRNVDVSLNPEELGKVKMRVATSENGITMIIQTERPETGDLMRRHINELAEEFRRMGFQDISFEFSSGDSAGGQAQQGLGDGTGAGTGHGASTGATDMSATDEVAETQIQNLRLGSTGVDMRV